MRRRKWSGDCRGLQSRRFGPSRIEWWVRLPHASATNRQCLCGYQRYTKVGVPYTCQSLRGPSRPNGVIKGLLAFWNPLRIMLPNDAFGVRQQRSDVGDGHPSNQEPLGRSMPELVWTAVDASGLENPRINLPPVLG